MACWEAWARGEFQFNHLELWGQDKGLIYIGGQKSNSVNSY